MKKLILASAIGLSSIAMPSLAADYTIDTKGAHASINFKVKHLGYSWLTGRFNTFSGEFSYDDKAPEASTISVNIDTTSIDSNHAERDKHLRDGDFLDVKKFSTASFNSTKVEDLGNGNLKVTGTLSLQGIEKEITIDVAKIGEGKDPWGGYRVGFAGTTAIQMKDFGYKMDFGQIDFDLHIEGIKK